MHQIVELGGSTIERNTKPRSNFQSMRWGATTPFSDSYFYRNANQSRVDKRGDFSRIGLKKELDTRSIGELLGNISDVCTLTQLAS